MTKIILSIFITANNSPILARHLLMAFGELEKPKTQKLSREINAEVRQN